MNGRDPRKHRNTRWMAWCALIFVAQFLYTSDMSPEYKLDVLEAILVFVAVGYFGVTNMRDGFDNSKWTKDHGR